MDRELASLGAQMHSSLDMIYKQNASTRSSTVSCVIMHMPASSRLRNISYCTDLYLLIEKKYRGHPLWIQQKFVLVLILQICIKIHTVTAWPSIYAWWQLDPTPCRCFIGMRDIWFYHPNAQLINFLFQNIATALSDVVDVLQQSDVSNLNYFHWTITRLKQYNSR